MPKPADVMKTTPLYQQQQQYEVSKFLNTKPLVLGFIIIGAVTVSAAHTRKPRLVKTSQMISYVNFAIAAFSLHSHLVLVWIIPDVSAYALVACDILIFIFSLAVAVTSCSCCCNPMLTPVMVSYVTTDLPVNHIMQMGQPDPSSVTQTISSVMYVLPAAHGPVPPAPLPNYAPIPNASPPMYSPVPATTPPNYSKVSGALPPNYGPVPSARPPAYDVIMNISE